MLRLLSYKAKVCKDFLMSSCHVGTHWIAFIECSQMSTHMISQGFSHFSVFLHYFVLANLAISSIRASCMYFNTDFQGQVRNGCKTLCETLSRLLNMVSQNYETLWNKLITCSVTGSVPVSQAWNSWGKLHQT